MRILEVVSGRGVNGAVVHCLRLTRELAARGHQLTLVCRPDAWIGAQVQSGAISVVRSDLHRWPLDELRRIAALIAERGIDVVHTHMSRAHLFGVLLRWFSPAPVVATAHNRVIQPHWMFNDSVIAVSDAVRRFQSTYNLVARTRIQVIHPFVEVARAASSGEVRRRVRTGLGIADAIPVVGWVGSIFRKKRVVELVRAFAAVLRTVTDARLVLVGEGPPSYKDRVKDEAARLGVASRIVWTGHSANVPDLMSAFDLLVVTSEEEAFPLVIVEAMAAGLPVVATGVGGIAESVVDGTTGLVVPARDMDGLAEAVSKVLADRSLGRTLGEAGRHRVHEHFSADTQVPKIEALFASARRSGPKRTRSHSAVG